MLIFVSPVMVDEVKRFWRGNGNCLSWEAITVAREQMTVAEARTSELNGETWKT